MMTARVACSRAGRLLAVLAAAVLTGGVTLAADYREIEWVELMPEEDLQALLNPPDYLADIPDGSPQDEIDSRLASGPSEEADNPYEKALRSTRVRGEFDGQRVRIPGFVVPLDFDAERNITAFFLVPYFGACLHTPPPPPNQIIYAEFSSGVRMDDIYYPYWLEGTLNVALEETELGTSAYTMAVDNVTPYEE